MGGSGNPALWYGPGAEWGGGGCLYGLPFEELKPKSLHAKMFIKLFSIKTIYQIRIQIIILEGSKPASPPTDGICQIW